jgi:hypothetical protein
MKKSVKSSRAASSKKVVEKAPLPAPAIAAAPKATAQPRPYGSGQQIARTR